MQGGVAPVENLKIPKSKRATVKQRWRMKLSCALARGVGSALCVGASSRRDDEWRSMQAHNDGAGAACDDDEDEDAWIISNIELDATTHADGHSSNPGPTTRE